MEQSPIRVQYPLKYQSGERLPLFLMIHTVVLQEYLPGQPEQRSGMPFVVYQDTLARCHRITLEQLSDLQSPHQSCSRPKARPDLSCARSID